MAEDKKQNVSVRLNVSDLAKIKEIAKRLQVRESDVFRFAIKATLAKLIPLHDSSVRGSDLVPAFIECGTELTSYFDLDALRLETIFNDGLHDPGKRVDSEDIELLAMAGIKENYVYLKLKDLASRQRLPMGPAALLRQHLYEKYIHQGYDESTEEQYIEDQHATA
ncbi:MAG: hypothetical protein PVF34_03190 [Gammaproteobacteria bacterium]|jgi:hypothetical protein